MLKKDFKNNFKIILELVQNIVIEKIKNKNGYNYYKNCVYLNQWVLDGLYQCNYCGNIWDGYAQCTCYNEL